MRKELKEIEFKDVRDTAVIRQYYAENENCRVVDNLYATGNTCILFISSNSIYFPNTEEAVVESLVGKDRYEWTNLAQTEPLKSEIARFLFIRDIFKQWYISGINDKVDGIDKLVDYLRCLVSGYRLITVGNSSGGYLAALLATKLNADRAFSVSGQWDIRDQAYKAPFVEAELRTGYEYLDIVELLSEKIPVYYLYPAQCQWDQEQSVLIKEKAGIVPIPFRQKGHGATCYGFNLPWLFMMDTNKLFELSKKAPIRGGVEQNKFSL